MLSMVPTVLLIYTSIGNTPAHGQDSQTLLNSNTAITSEQQQFLDYIQQHEFVFVAELVRIYDYPTELNQSPNRQDGMVFARNTNLKGKVPDYVDGELIGEYSRRYPHLHPGLTYIGNDRWRTDYQLHEEYVLIATFSKQHNDYKIIHGMPAKAIMPHIIASQLKTP